MTGDAKDDETTQVHGTVINVASGQVNGSLIQLGHISGDLIVQAPQGEEPD